MNDRLACWKCSAAIEVDGRFSRLEACKKCGTELHVCVMCIFHEPNRANACREEHAEPPNVKDRANFCDYFLPRPGAFDGAHMPAEAAARAQLADLFGESEASSPRTESDEARAALEALFKPTKN